GAQLELRLPLTVTLHGKTQTYSAELLATRLDDRRFQVVTLEPVVLHAEDFDLAPGVAALRKAAGLKSISLSVPVGAVLIFTAR
ncbi:YceI family protein, partial [Pseudomonas cedrina subsp. fulgida]|nr:YceI family protein [Pseudomonas cedrina subsp. fulgida]